MNDITNPEVGTEVSTLSADVAVDSINSNLDVQTSAFDELLGDMEFFDPQVDADKPEVELEVSEEDELETSEDDSNIDEDVDDDVTEDDDQDTADSIVDWEEMQQHSFEIDGKSYSANDLKAALGRQSKQDEARNEVEAAKAELEAQKAEFEAQKASVQLSQTAMEGQSKLTQLESTFETLVEQRDKALAEEDVHNLTIINTKIQQVQQAYNQIHSETVKAQKEQAANAAKRLEQFGFGDLNTDTQRREAFVSYAKNVVPAELASVVNTSPELLALVEKARLFDKGQNESTKGKLKGAKKTLKGRAAKTKSPVKKQADPMKALADSVIDDIFNS